MITKDSPFKKKKKRPCLQAIAFQHLGNSFCTGKIGYKCKNLQLDKRMRLTDSAKSNLGHALVCQLVWSHCWQQSYLWL